jgi:hypothetical protein
VLGWIEHPAGIAHRLVIEKKEKFSGGKRCNSEVELIGLRF